MTKPIRRPIIAAVSHEDAGCALNRLIAIASGDTGGSRRVAEFLLSWWDGGEGGWSLIDISNVDGETSEDMLIILAFLAQNNVTYAKEWGREEDMVRLINHWNWKGRGDA